MFWLEQGSSVLSSDCKRGAEGVAFHGFLDHCLWESYAIHLAAHLQACQGKRPVCVDSYNQTLAMRFRNYVTVVFA